MDAKKYVYPFLNGKADGRGDMKDLLGGKGAGLAEMTNAGLPVPPGFTITTEACNDYTARGNQFADGVMDQSLAALARVEDAAGKKFGDAKNPLLVSVRSGAKFSMPGMMDTVLNLGLNDDTVQGLAELTSNPRFAADAYRRFLQMFGRIVLGIDGSLFEHAFDAMKKKQRAKQDTDLRAEALQTVCTEFQKIVKQATGAPFPMDPKAQLTMAIKAVFASWNGKRAVDYRRVNKIADTLGTAVNVVTMVFGNMGDDSGTGVAFTRNPATGENELYGEFLSNAQGEDVVAGIRTPLKITELKKLMPEVYEQFREVAVRLERHYKDVQDLEFTIERGKLWMLQTRNAKRTGAAAVKIAMDMMREGLIDANAAVLRVEPAHLDQLLHPIVDPNAKVKVLATGLPASPGAAKGKVVFDPDEAERRGENGEPVILVRIETSPEDFHGMVVAQGILTARGGMTSHAAVVARGMGKCCVAGCDSLLIDYKKKLFKANGVTVKAGDFITLDGTSGRVILGQVPLVEARQGLDVGELMKLADEIRTLNVRTNADTPNDAKVARKFGAEGIGLCRTEHMFFEGDRIDSVRQMILGAADYKRIQGQLDASENDLKKATSGDKKKTLQSSIAKLKKELVTPKALYLGALKKLLPMQKKDFVGIFKAMDGLPVTIRTLDPPLHEFLPHGEGELKALAKKLKVNAQDLIARCEQLREANPMLGHRGCRLGIVYPEITEMQARAIFEAAALVMKKGVKVYPEIMIPLVGHVNEYKLQEEVVRRVASEVMEQSKIKIDYLVGTMIELPRAALTADEIARHAEFFSFGTNDLTQTTLGLSRDDAGRFLPLYVEKKILPDDPFQTIDKGGVGKLLEMGVKLGRSTRANLKVGICGEHGGDPQSIEFCHRVGLNYVSCSPYRVPIARLAAAQARLQEGNVERVSRTA